MRGQRASPDRMGWGMLCVFSCCELHVCSNMTFQPHLLSSFCDPARKEYWFPVWLKAPDSIPGPCCSYDQSSLQTHIFSPSIYLSVSLSLTHTHTHSILEILYNFYHLAGWLDSKSVPWDSFFKKIFGQTQKIKLPLNSFMFDTLKFSIFLMFAFCFCILGL